MPTRAEPPLVQKARMSNTFQALLLFVRRVFVKEADSVPVTEVLYLDTDSGAIEVVDSRQNYLGTVSLLWLSSAPTALLGMSITKTLFYSVYQRPKTWIEES